MIDNEFETIALAIKAAYPNSNVLPDKYAMKTWYIALADLDYHVVENAVWELINTSVFPPSIAEIRGKCAGRKAEIPDWGEAWYKVQRAIRYYGQHRDDEALASMDDITREAVKRMGFKSLCTSDLKNCEIDRAQFRDIYNVIAKRRMEDVRISPAVLAERERIRRQYISQQGEEKPRLVDYSKEIERSRENVSSPEYVQALLEREGYR